MEEGHKHKAATSNTMGFPSRGPMGGSLLGGAKAKNFKISILKLIKYLDQYKLSLLIVVLFAIGSTLFSIISPKMLGNITNEIVDDFINMTVYDRITENLPPGVVLEQGITGEIILKQMPESEFNQIPENQLERIRSLDLSQRPTIDFNDIRDSIILLIILYIISTVLNYLQVWTMGKISQMVTFRLRKEVFKKINSLPLSYFDANSTGDILSRITNDIDTISQTLNQSLGQIIISVTSIIGILIMMLSISWQLTVVAILVLPISFIFIGLIIKKSQKLFSQQQETLGEINGFIEENYSAHIIVRAYNSELISIRKFNKINLSLYNSGWKSQFLSGLLMPIMSFIGNLGYVAVATVGGWLAINGKLGIGGIQAFIQYLQQFNQPILQAANITNVLQSTAAAAERVFELLEEPEETAETVNNKKLALVKGHINFANVSFGYSPNKSVITNFSVDIKPGQRVAIVGPTGAGKTTIVNLLMRFYDVNLGTISIDGIDIRDMKRSDLRDLFAMVLQDTWLFNGAIKDNIAYSKVHASEGEIVQAAKAAQVDHFVHSLPKGYDMVLNESSDNISQGEKQLLTIARAMLANAPILILDEATSSVDTRTEILIQKAMDKLMEGRTSFIIAHRLSTIKNADLILVLDKGNIIEQGTHADLMAQTGFYFELYNSQFEE